MSEVITIANDKQLQIREYNGQRVVTFRDIDMAHGRTSGTARRSFNTHRKRFVEGVDCFVRNSYEARKEYGVAAPNGLILVSESGYLMLAKSFNDDIAWQVQRELVNNYFRAKAPEEKPQLVKRATRYVGTDDAITALEVLRFVRNSYVEVGRKELLPAIDEIIKDVGRIIAMGF